jgi:hypothetical protein
MLLVRLLLAKEYVKLLAARLDGLQLHPDTLHAYFPNFMYTVVQQYPRNAVLEERHAFLPSFQLALSL